MRALLRLRDDPGVGPELRADLERAVAVDEPYDVASGEAKLLAALATS